MNSSLSLMSLFATGAHRGNHKSTVNPRLSGLIHSVKDQICFWDLTKVNSRLDKALLLMNKCGSKKQQIMIVGTSHHVKDVVQDFAKKFASEEMPYVCNRWIGGTLTNRKTINISVTEIKKVESYEENERFYKSLSAGEKLQLREKKERGLRLFGGIRVMKSVKPGCLIILDAANNRSAIKEAEKMNIPVIILTNANITYLPNEKLNYIIPCNNNSIKTINLIMETLVDSYNTGLKNFVEEVKPEKPQPKEGEPNENRSDNRRDGRRDSRPNRGSGFGRNEQRTRA